VADSFDSSAWRAMAEAAAAHAAAADGDQTRAHDHFDAAARLYACAEQPYWAARSHAQAQRAGNVQGTPAA